VVGSGTFMSALDTSIVNVALPAIGHATGASLATLEWVVLAYMLTVSCTLLLFGRLADLHGLRRVYMLGQACFALGSLACGLSGRIGWLVPARMFQGLGASMVFALSPAVLIGAFPGEERGRALGLQATMTYLGMSIGPGLGGWLTERFGWHAIFLVNVPIGAVMLGLSSRVLGRDGGRSRGAMPPFDSAGVAWSALCLLGLLLAMSLGPDLGWGHAAVLLLLALAGGAGAAFLRREGRLEHPALDIGLFRNRVFSGSTLAAFLCYSCTAAVNFASPFLLIRGFGLAEGRAGLFLMAVPLGMLSLTAAAGRLSDRVGVRIPATLGMVLLSLGAFTVASAGPARGLHTFLAGALAIGMGNGLFTAPNNSAIMGAAPAARRGVAGAVLAAARTTGFACGTGLAGIVLASRLRSLGPGAPAAIVPAAHACFVAVGLLGALAAVTSYQRKA
jgi:EmrB/QacA subfamily drug resistance transporter